MYTFYNPVVRIKNLYGNSIKRGSQLTHYFRNILFYHRHRGAQIVSSHFTDATLPAPSVCSLFLRPPANLTAQLSLAGLFKRLKLRL